MEELIRLRKENEDLKNNALELKMSMDDFGIEVAKSMNMLVRGAPPKEIHLRLAMAIENVSEKNYQSKNIFGYQK